jgi:hypothetical protein
VLKEPGFYSPGSLLRLLPCPVSENSLSETVRKGTDLLSVYPSGLSEKGIFGRFRLFLVLRIPAKFTLGAFLAFLFGQCLSSRHFRR